MAVFSRASLIQRMQSATMAWMLVKSPALTRFLRIKFEPMLSADAPACIQPAMFC